MRYFMRLSLYLLLNNSVDSVLTNFTFSAIECITLYLGSPFLFLTSHALESDGTKKHVRALSFDQFSAFRSLKMLYILLVVLYVSWKPLQRNDNFSIFFIPTSIEISEKRYGITFSLDIAVEVHIGRLHVICRCSATSS